MLSFSGRRADDGAMTSGESRIVGGGVFGVARGGDAGGWRDAAIVAAAGAVLWWLCRFHASWVPFWAPWDFSWLWFGGYALALWSYARGLRRVATPGWRIALFLVGMAAIWAVIQTRYEYLAQHMFFFNRIQHVTMHHLGPFLIAAAWPWPVLAAGAPKWLRRTIEHRWFDAGLRFFQRPDVACVVFVGLIALWLFPPVHFVAMIGFDPGVPIAFDPTVTVLSLLAAIVGAVPGFALASSRRWRFAPALGGAAVGLAIVLMHYGLSGPGHRVLAHGLSRGVHRDRRRILRPGPAPGRQR